MMLMQERAVVYGVIAWLLGWLIDLLIEATSQPILLAPILKAIVVLACLAVIGFGLAKNAWLLKTTAEPVDVSLR
jgi:hypothetical protein